jgi:putative tricarboxylic transport membrane protein
MNVDRLFSYPLQRMHPVYCFCRFAVALFITAVCTAPMANAQWVPSGQVEIVVPNSPGGANDGVARLIQKSWKNSRLLDVPSVVVNKPSGSGNATLSYLSQKPGNGHYLAAVSITQQLNYIVGTSTFRHQDFTPLATMIGDFVAFAVRAESPVKSGKELLEILKKDPGALNVGVTAVGGNNHIALVLATQWAGIDSKKLKTPVFQSSGDSLTALLGGHIEVHAGSVGPLMNYVETGRVRIIALSSDQRLPGPLAQVPTWKEQGVNAVFNTWRGLWGPKGMTASQISYWDNVLGRISQSDEWKRDLEKNVWENDYRNSSETTKYLDALDSQLKEALKEIGLARNF